jgi:hypothetical protein
MVKISKNVYPSLSFTGMTVLVIAVTVALFLLTTSKSREKSTENIGRKPRRTKKENKLLALFVPKNNVLFES